MSKQLSAFVVRKAGRVVDCIKAKDIGLAMQEALDKWEKYCVKKGCTLSVDFVPDVAVKPLIVKPTKAEVMQYGAFGSAGQSAVPSINPVFAAMHQSTRSTE